MPAGACDVAPVPRACYDSYIAGVGDMPLTKFLEGSAFDPETVKLMGTAFDDACRQLGLADRTDPLTAIVAGKIIAAAKAGERDPQRLCAEALKGTDR